MCMLVTVLCVCVCESEHQELGKQVQACRSDRLRQDLEREIENLVKKMEGKGEQIAKVRRHQAQVSFILTLHHTAITRHNNNTFHLKPTRFSLRRSRSLHRATRLISVQE